MNTEHGLTDHLERTARDLVLQFTAFELMHDYAALMAMGSGTLWRTWPVGTPTMDNAMRGSGPARQASLLGVERISGAAWWSTARFRNHTPRN
jgi:hypothetical protein